jgi:hypothetical protein
MSGEQSKIDRWITTSARAPELGYQPDQRLAQVGDRRFNAVSLTIGAPNVIRRRTRNLREIKTWPIL